MTADSPRRGSLWHAIDAILIVACAVYAVPGIFYGTLDSVGCCLVSLWLIALAAEHVIRNVVAYLDPEYCLECERED